MAPTHRRTALFALLGANAVSMTGNVIALVAVPWFVLQTTGSPALTGVAAFFNFLPTVIAGLLGGTLIDRIGYKKMSVLADLGSAITVAMIPLLHETVGLELWQLITLIFFGALLDAPGTTARGAMIPDVAAEAGWTLEAASGANQVVERGSRLVGAPLAGVLIALLGPENVLWANAATFGLSAFIVTVAVPAKKALQKQTGYLTQFKEGVSFLLGDRLLRAIVVTVTLTNFLDAIGMILLPVFSDRVYGDAVGLGLLLGANGGGAVVGALVFARWGDRLPRRLIFAAGFLTVIVWYPVLAFYPPLGIAIVAKFISGVGAGPLNPIIDTISYERVPSGMRGRVFGVIVAAAWMALPLGVLLGGVALEAIGLRMTILLTGAAYFVAALTIWINPAIKLMDKLRSSQGSTPSDEEVVDNDKTGVDAPVDSPV